MSTRASDPNLIGKARRPQPADLAAAVEALAAEWEAVPVADEWDAADRWASAPADLRALLARYRP